MMFFKPSWKISSRVLSSFRLIKANLHYTREHVKKSVKENVNDNTNFSYLFRKNLGGWELHQSLNPPLPLPSYFCINLLKKLFTEISIVIEWNKSVSSFLNNLFNNAFIIHFRKKINWRKKPHKVNVKCI